MGVTAQGEEGRNLQQRGPGEKAQSQQGAGAAGGGRDREEKEAPREVAPSGGLALTQLGTRVAVGG